MNAGQHAEMAVAFCLIIGFPIWDVLTMGALRRNSTHATRMNLYRTVILVEWLAVGLVWLVRHPVQHQAGLYLRPDPNPLAAVLQRVPIHPAFLAIVGGGFFVGLALPVVAAWLNPALREKSRSMLKAVEFLLPKGPQERLTFAAVALTAGICEEILYRGFLLHALATAWHMPPVWTVACAITAFGLAHLYQGWVGFLTTSMAGALFVAVYCVTGSLLPGIVLHALIDLRPLLLLGGEQDPSMQAAPAA